MKTLVVVADRTLSPSSELLQTIAGELMSGSSSRVRVRSTLSHKVTSPLEQAVCDLVQALQDRQYDVDVEYVSPQGNRRNHVYARDHVLVRGAHKVLAYFSHTRFMYGGTGHVVESALAKNVPVRAYLVGPHGALASYDDGVYEAA